MSDGGPATPVVTVTDRAADAGPALRVAVVSDGRPTEAGPARPVIEVTDGRPTQGNDPMPVVVATGAQAGRVLAGPAIPVVVVSGSINPNIAPANTALPAISGILLTGETLSTTDGTWTGTPAPTFTYQWKRGGVDIGGATNSTYVLVPADSGTTITVTVTATNAAGSASATSASVAPTTWLLDRFLVDAAAPLATPRTCDPGPGTLTLVQTDGQYSIVGNLLTEPAQATPVFGDLGFFMIGGVARVCGRALAATINLTTRSNAFLLGFNRTGKVSTGFADSAEMAFLSGATTYAACNNAQASALPTFGLVFSANGVYDVMVVLRKITQAENGILRGGALYFLRGGAFASWTLIYTSVVDTTVTVFPSHGNFASAGTWSVLKGYDLGYGFATQFGAARRIAQPADGQNMDAPVSDGTWEVIWLPLAAEVWDFSVRRVDDNNRWIIRSDQANSNIKIFEKNAGVETQRGSTGAQTWTVTSVYRIIISARGTTIEVRVENLTGTPGIADLRTSYTSATFQQTATGMAVSGTSRLRDLAAWPLTLDPTVTPAAYSDLAANNAITLRSPKPFQVVQRSGVSNTLLISGSHNVAGAQDIEASWNGGAYATIASSVSPGPFSGSLTGLAAGQGTLSVRIVATPTIIASAASVGIGDVFVIAGQSNAQGQGTNAQAYTGTAGLFTMLGIDYVYKTGADPVGATARSADSVLNTSGGNSVWPLVATSFVTSQGVPIQLIPASQGATAILAWQPGASHTDRSTLYGQLIVRAQQQPNGIKAVLWWQGETDALSGVTQATYYSRLASLATAILADLGVKIMPCKLQNCSGISAPNQAAINAAIGQAWLDTSTTLTGPDLTGIDTAPEDTLHLLPDAKLISAAALWWAALQAAFGYP